MFTPFFPSNTGFWSLGTIKIESGATLASILHVEIRKTVEYEAQTDIFKIFLQNDGNICSQISKNILKCHPHDSRSPMGDIFATNVGRKTSKSGMDLA